MNKYGFFRAAAAVPNVVVGNCKANADSIIALAIELNTKGVEMIVMPELCITAYTCADLFHNCELLEDAKTQIRRVAEASSQDFNAALIVGAPLLVNGTLFNCAFVISQGKVLGIVPKTYLPNYNEFYEKRWWASASEAYEDICIEEFDNAPFGTRQLFDINGVKVGVEICEDLWTPIPPSCYAAMQGAQVIANLSASDDLIGKLAYIHQLLKQQSARCICGYVYSGAGYGESSTDLVFDGKALIAENGSLLAANQRWQSKPQYEIADIDIKALAHDRMSNGSFVDCSALNRTSKPYALRKAPAVPCTHENLYRKINARPFVPPTDEAIAQRCSEIVNIQAAGLAKRLDHIKAKTMVIGISGGLDSTLALLVGAKAFDRLGLDRKGIIGITMPGFGTSKRTKNNAVKLMEELRITSREISIAAAVSQHFSDIGHNPEVHDVTYENSQARERTQILMDVANQVGGIVLGTGDLSELALGWATYNGDHMSMYAINAGVPKTLVKYLVKYFAQDPEYADCSATLLDIVDTPISPELTPTDAEGKIAQKTEDLVGPYELHDFFLYHTLRFGRSWDTIFYMATQAFQGSYNKEEIKKWLNVFAKRFFQQQFKRSCLPDGPKVGSVCLSPRGDWRMPSDAFCFLTQS